MSEEVRKRRQELVKRWKEKGLLRSISLGATPVTKFTRIEGERPPRTEFWDDVADEALEQAS